MNALPRVLIACIALTCAAVAVACGGDDSTTATPTGAGQTTPTPRPSASPTPTPEPSASPLTADSPEVSAVLALDGFRAFAAQFQAAIAANDAEWIIDHTHFEVTDCPSPGQPIGTPTPRFCQGMGYPPVGPGIFVAVWSSEGDTITQESYEDNMRTSFAQNSTPQQMYAFGAPFFHVDLAAHETAIVVSKPAAQISDPGSDQLGAPATAFHVAQFDDGWKIVEVDGAGTNLVPYYLTWYAPWSEVFPAY